MTDSSLASLIGVVIGGGIAFLSGWGLAKIQESRTKKLRRSLFTEALIIDLETSIGIYSKIASDWEKTQQVWYEQTIELREYRKFYHLYPDNVLLFSKDLRKRILNYYIQTDKAIRILEESQNRLITWAREYQKGLRAAEQAFPDLPKEEIQKMVAKLIEFETDEAANSSRLAEKIINTTLAEYKSEAQAILEQLKKRNP